MSESPAEILSKAASLLRDLSEAAPPPPWRAFGGAIGAPADTCTCGSPADLSVGYRHEPGCGFEHVADADAGSAELMVALRPVAVPLADWLEHQAQYAYTLSDHRHYVSGHGAHAMAVAQAILGASPAEVTP